MIKKYTVVYKESDSVDEEIKFYEYLGPYQLWVILSKVENRFIYYPSTKEDLLFVEYDGYIWDCTNIDRLRQIKLFLAKEYAKELKYEF